MKIFKKNKMFKKCKKLQIKSGDGWSRGSGGGKSRQLYLNNKKIWEKKSFQNNILTAWESNTVPQK